MPTVLVNADDFGLHRDIDRGILDCVEKGVVQSLSFSPNGQSIDWRKLHELMRVGVRVGLHVTLVGEPWMTDGRIISYWTELFKQVAFGGKPFREALEREIDWQVKQCVDHGIALSHIDSHQHVHAFPGIAGPIVRAACEQNIPRVRVPWCPTTSVIKKNVGGIALQTLARRLRGVVKKSGKTFLPILGLAQAGHNTVDVYAREFAAIDPMDIELCVHPGVNTPELEARYRDWNFDWTGERDALLSPTFREIVSGNGFTLARIVPSQTSAVA